MPDNGRKTVEGRDPQEQRQPPADQALRPVTKHQQRAEQGNG